MNLEKSEKGEALFAELKSYVEDYEKIVSFIKKVLRDKPIQQYFAWKMMLAPLPQKRGGAAVDTTRVTIVADNNFFEFIFSKASLRYDVVPIDSFFRVEEIHYVEKNLNGKDVLAIEASLDSEYFDIAQEYSVKGKEKVEELEEFIRQVRKIIAK